MPKPKQKLSKAAAERVANYEAKSTLVEGRTKTRRKDNFVSLGIIAGAIVVALVGQFSYFNFGPGIPNDPSVVKTAPAPALSENRVWTGSMNLASADLEFELYGDKAPQAVANFVSLAQAGFFDTTSCHRLTTEGIYVLQCGDPAGTGAGGPGYSFGPIENAPADDLYREGVIAMARQGGNASSMGSQFFIVYQDSTIGSDSAGGYTVFGKVTKNLDAVSKLAAIGTNNGSSDGYPKNPIPLTAVTVK
jgi:peptidyl-prolyl cis-trans isomerase B (cyclophilin B)